MKKIFLGALVVLLSVSVVGNVWAASVYAVDSAHSTIGFAVKHMMVAKVNGVFADFKSDIKFDAADLAGSKFDFVINAASINTRNDARDSHLKSADFFDAEKYPTITFVTKKVEKTGEGAYAVTGDLTMKAVTKEIVIPVTVDGPVFNPMAKADGIGIEAVFKLNRQDYGVNWNKSLDNGGVVVANDVAVNVNLEAHKS
ncbi:MAG: YceI family protein [Candidatus Omnitrophica bacterium]|nr:YceI family protein [Candidatus Omnitrophota bacterium]